MTLEPYREGGGLHGSLQSSEQTSALGFRGAACPCQLPAVARALAGLFLAEEPLVLETPRVWGAFPDREQ